MTQIVVKEDVVFVRDGAVAEFNSVKEYLDAFKIHLENVRLNRMIRDEEDFRDDLAFLEAKLKFLIFMSQKKRTAKEIETFLSQFPSKISTRLAAIPLCVFHEKSEVGLDRRSTQGVFCMVPKGPKLAGW